MPMQPLKKTHEIIVNIRYLQLFFLFCVIKFCFFSACSKQFRFGHVQKAKGQAHRYWGFNVYGQAYNLGLVHCIPYTKFLIGHVNNIPTMQFFPGISRNSQSKSQMLSLTECVWDIQNNALWDTHCLLSELVTHLAILQMQCYQKHNNTFYIS